MYPLRSTLLYNLPVSPVSLKLPVSVTFYTHTYKAVNTLLTSIPPCYLNRGAEGKLRWRYWPGSPLRLRACSLSLCPGLPQESSGPLSPPRCPGAGTGSHLWSRSAGRGDTDSRDWADTVFFLNPFSLFLLLPAFYLSDVKCVRLCGFTATGNSTLFVLLL